MKVIRPVARPGVGNEVRSIEPIFSSQRIFVKRSFMTIISVFGLAINMTFSYVSPSACVRERARVCVCVCVCVCVRVCVVNRFVGGCAKLPTYLVRPCYIRITSVFIR